MNTATAYRPPLRHPLAEPFLAFSLLPSMNQHVTQAAALVPGAVLDQIAGLPNLHRHWSAEMNNTLEPLAGLDDPVLPLAMLPAERFDTLALYAGAVLAGQPIRRCIARADVQAMQPELGDAVLDFTRHRAAAIHAGLDDLTWRTEAIAADTVALGQVLLAQAFQMATPAVRQRGLLRLPIATSSHAQALSLSPAESLRISLALLQEIEPKWFSLFPITH